MSSISTNVCIAALFDIVSVFLSVRIVFDNLESVNLLGNFTKVTYVYCSVSCVQQGLVPPGLIGCEKISKIISRI